MKNIKKILMRLLLVLLNIIVIVILPALISFFVELMQIRDVNQTKEWMMTHPYQILLGYAFILIFFILLYTICCRLWVAMLGTSLTFMILAMINYYKISLRGDPFMPWDLSLGKEATNIMLHIDISIDQTTWYMLGTLLLITLVLVFIKPAKLKWYYRIIGVTVFLSIGIFLGQQTYFNSDNMEKMGIQDIFWNQTRNYEINGFLTGFGMNIRNAIIQPPSSYNEKSVNKIIDEYMEALPAFSVGDREKTPNIIMIMNEALWDPTLLSGIEYSENPMPTINKIRQEGTSGWVLVPGYGGATANTEFEVLTGHSVSFFPAGSMAYQQYIKGPLGSMASYLKGMGYSTTAIHPYVKWFWDRETVYPYLGFERFISDEDFKEPHKRGAFISDMETSQEIIRQYEEQKGKPFFNYTVTMQNHGPYNDNRYGDDRIKVKGGNLSKESKDILEVYTQGVKDADTALGYLIDYFESVDEPTIIVMFGDHLPMLGDDYLVYKEAGYTSPNEITLEDNKKLHLTPLVIWNNYHNKKQDIGIIGGNYLGALTMKYAQMEMPLYFTFLDKLYEENPAYIKGLGVDKDGNISEFLSSNQEEVRQKHWMLQYDLMFGKEYSKEILYTY